MSLPPLIVTAKMDDESAEYYTGLRRQWFSPERNFLKAHITLFHQLPFEQWVLDALKNFIYPTFLCADLTWGRLGNGFCVRIACGELSKLHFRLSALFKDKLIRQDIKHYLPHITIQNKVAPDIATKDFEFVSKHVALVPVEVAGLEIWVYRKGPWELLDETVFARQ